MHILSPAMNNKSHLRNKVRFFFKMGKLQGNNEDLKQVLKELN